MKTFLFTKLITTQHLIHSYASQLILLSKSFNMKFTAIAIISALIAPLAYAAALSPANINALAARNTNAQSGYEDVVGYALPDGTRKIDFYLNGVLEGSAVETKDGGMVDITHHW